jgi:integrase
VIVRITSSMVEHRTLNPLVPSSSLGLSIFSKPRLARGFVLSTFPSLTEIAISEDAGSIEFMFWAGCRLCEVTALSLGDIDRDFKTISFERTLVLSDGGSIVKQGLKTQQRRVYPCCEGLQVFLKSIAPEEIDRGRLVFTPPKAKYVDMHNFSSRKWKPILLAAGIDYQKLSSIRHTYITFCIDGGMDAKDVAKLVGNFPEIIYRHYAGARRNLVAPDI